MSDSLTLVSEIRLRELLQKEQQLEKSREVVEVARTLLERHCIQKYREELKDALKELDESAGEK